MPPSATGDDACSAWNPGIQPGIPSEYRPLETILRQESVSSTLEEVSELAQLTGLKHEELVAFRPERLALHELIVRVTAEIVVAEGAEEEEFGRNFREIVAAIWQRDVLPHLTELAHLHAQLRARRHPHQAGSRGIPVPARDRDAATATPFPIQPAAQLAADRGGGGTPAGR
ncbi:MAG TPA: hypothetical protein VIX81_02610 [Gammaproteobacteria bacterium]